MPRPPSWKINLAMLWISQLFVMAGFAAMIPFVSLFIKNDLHVTDPGSLGFYVSMFSFAGAIGYAVFCPIWGMLSDRFGIKPMLLRGTFVSAIFFPMMGYVSHPGTLVALRFITAACAGTTAASHIMIARTTPNNRQGFAQGVLNSAYWSGSVLGNVIGGLLIHYFNYRYAFWFCGILYFLAGFAILFTRDNGELMTNRAAMHPHHRYHPFGPLPAFSSAVLMLFALFFVNAIARTTDIPYFALRIESFTSKEAAPYWTGIISGIVCIGAVLSGVIGGYLIDRIAPLKVLRPAVVITAVTLALQGFTSSLVFFTITRTLQYFVMGAINPLLQKLLSAVTPARKRGASFGFSSTAASAGSAVSAMLGGAVFSLSGGTTGVFIAAAIFFLATLPLYERFIVRIMTKKYYHAN